MSDDSMLDAIASIDAAGDDYHGVYKGYRVRYINGVVSGNESLIKAFDRYEATNEKSSTTEIVEARGSFIYELLKRSNEISDNEARELATPEGTKELARIWWQSRTDG